MNHAPYAILFLARFIGLCGEAALRQVPFDGWVECELKIGGRFNVLPASALALG
ncbi:MAG: hypothetical protein MSG64_10780 [Pyrinomonadaceae bacterium MAG19_C2-C3]|nr:hypothetical protein [Pyrinomonadaceae bacterium MAG19_C2-C3]